MFATGSNIFHLARRTNVNIFRRLHQSLSCAQLKACTSQQYYAPNIFSIRKYYQLSAYDLSDKTTEESLYDFYSKFGKLEEVNIKSHKRSPQSLRFANICFARQEDMKRALTSAPHVIDNKEVMIVEDDEHNLLFVANLPKGINAHLRKYTAELIQICVVKFAAESGVRKALDACPLYIGHTELSVRPLRPKISTLFVGLLAPKTTDERLKSYFSQFGDVKHCQVRKHTHLNYSLCTGYVTFSSAEELKKAVEAAPHTLDGKRISIGNSSLGANLHRSALKSIIVSNIPRSLTPRDVEKFYFKFGEVHEATLYYTDPTWCAVVTFAEASQAKEALASRPHTISSVSNRVKNVLVKVRPYYTEKDTLVVTGLHPRSSKYTIKKYFAQFGDVIHMQVLVDRKINKSHCVATVSYASSEHLENALHHTNQHEIDGNQLRVERFKHELVETKRMDKSLIEKQLLHS
uniref:RRM domain-containing protein n=1 Tax=Ditylenchus dipsaci TaxID=166011 RepID=A0A915E767_9BILA